jgi:hypothetical protein
MERLIKRIRSLVERGPDKGGYIGTLGDSETVVNNSQVAVSELRILTSRIRYSTSEGFERCAEGG